MLDFTNRRHCTGISSKNEQRSIFGIILITVFAIAFTRAINLTYNMTLHPDEWVFYENTDSLLSSLLHPGMEFVENKEYPEGAYLFHLPFLFLGRLLRYLFGLPYQAQLWTRISSVCYFTLATVIGMHILWKYLAKSKTSLVIYALTMCFSVFFIEHSRYGVGDMISLFLLLLIIDLTAGAFDSGEKPAYLFSACFACGAMGAVKWPQLLFIVIPISTYLYQAPKSDRKVIIKRSAALLATFALAFLLFSPKAAMDWHYFIRASKREMMEYVVRGKAYEAGGLLNHIVQIVLYSLLYSDFPFAIGFTAVALVQSFHCALPLLRKREVSEKDTLTTLFHLIIPAVCILFFTYNLFIKMLVFRTYTPFFGLSTLYVAYITAQLYKKGKLHRILIVLLTILMVLRGASLIYIMHDDGIVEDQIQSQIADVVDDQWNRTILINSYIVPFDTTQLKNPTVMRIDSMADFDANGIELQPGDLVITGAYEFGLGGKYVLPVSGEHATDRNNAWLAFKEVNRSYWKGQTYPDYYYYLFGGWIRGGSFSTFLMPCNYIYYHS